MSTSLNDAIEGIMDRGFRMGATGLDPTERTILTCAVQDREEDFGQKLSEHFAAR